MIDKSVLAILNHVVTYMEKEGANRKNVDFNIDEDLVTEISTSTREKYTLSELKEAADKCFAHEWIEHASMAGKYRSLRITEKGVGIVRSKRRQELEKKNRPLLKKVSDYIEDRRGLFIFLGFTIALTSLLLKIYGDK